MLTSISISGARQDTGDSIQKYIRRKIGRLDSYVPRQSRADATAVIHLSTTNITARRESTCEASLHLPDGTVTAKETTTNMFAAVDIVTARLKNELIAAKPLGLRRVISKFRG